jgi:hypothetical protein
MLWEFVECVITQDAHSYLAGTALSSSDCQYTFNFLLKENGEFRRAIFLPRALFYRRVKHSPLTFRPRSTTASLIPGISWTRQTWAFWNIVKSHRTANEELSVLFSHLSQRSVCQVSSLSWIVFCIVISTTCEYCNYIGHFIQCHVVFYLWVI